MTALDDAFASPHGRAALMPYLMAGYPDLDGSRAIGEACIEAGADVLELGIPFSDPLADGPVIQAAGTAALAAGTTVDGALEVVSALAPRIPVVVMCYANPIVRRGAQAFAAALADAGAAGLIVPDLPTEEAGELLAACDGAGIALVGMAAPTTSPERFAAIGAAARGFLYAVTLTGTTGEREGLADTVPDLLARAHAATSVPVAVGFGIGTPELAAQAAGLGADGVIVGSRLVREAATGAAAVGSLVASFAAALAAG